MATRLIVDVHTHAYLPRYVSLLRTRTTAPRIISANIDGKSEDRLLILENDSGRPVGPQYWDRAEKLKFMYKHGIDVSIVSTANPWLDFLPAAKAQTLAIELNEDLEEYCSSSPMVENSNVLHSLYGFGLLPLVPEVSISAVLETIDQISTLPHLKGVILGTQGVGKGLDDPSLDPVWQAIEKAGLVIFLHPHYGVDGKAWGPLDNGHVLPLALGFPFETTTATTRLILSGVFDRFPNLRLLLAHSGGALPLLSSRLASCIEHDPVVASRLTHDARYYLDKIYFDAVAYGAEELAFVSDVIARSSRFASDAIPGSSTMRDRNFGSGRMMFGTDHPFFPPLKGVSSQWKSVVENLDAIDGVQGWSQSSKDGVRGDNALALFGLQK